jgi:signal transduction histidine kinase
MTTGTAEPDERLRTLVHALRTPLTIVEGFADALSRRGDDMSSEERAEYLERIGDAAREMAELLDGAGR